MKDWTTSGGIVFFSPHLAAAGSFPARGFCHHACGNEQSVHMSAMFLTLVPYLTAVTGSMQHAQSFTTAAQNRPV